MRAIPVLPSDWGAIDRGIVPVVLAVRFPGFVGSHRSNFDERSVVVDLAAKYMAKAVMVMTMSHDDGDGNGDSKGDGDGDGDSDGDSDGDG